MENIEVLGLRIFIEVPKILVEVYPHGGNNIEAAKDAIDEFCLFKVDAVNGKLTLKADNSKFFTINQNWNYNIEAECPPGNMAKFEIGTGNMMLW